MVEKLNDFLVRVLFIINIHAELLLITDILHKWRVYILVHDFDHYIVLISVHIANIHTCISLQVICEILRKKQKPGITLGPDVI